MSSLAVGSVLGDFRVEGVVGHGGMGVVYHAVQLSLGRPVALKLIAPHLADDDDFRERFVRESRLSASIDHPHIVPVYVAGEEEGLHYIAMRFVEGITLRTAITAEGRQMIDFDLDDLEKKLDPLQFVSVHRSAIVNLDHVKEMECGENRNGVLRLTSGETIPFSRRLSQRLKAMLEA